MAPIGGLRTYTCWPDFVVPLNSEPNDEYSTSANASMSFGSTLLKMSSERGVRRRRRTSTMSRSSNRAPTPPPTAAPSADELLELEAAGSRAICDVVLVCVDVDVTEVV